MFTGIVQHVGVVRDVRREMFGKTILVDPSGWSHRPAPGDSIAVSGCCLTVAEPGDDDAGCLRFDAVRQTLDVTTLDALEPGDGVNLEHAVTPTTLLGGHLVQGHVDGTAEVRRVETSDEDRRLTIAPPPALHAYVFDKGSVALDGVSLTVAARHDDDFEVALIPTTLERTTLGALEPGARVNLEVDVVAKTIVEHARRCAAGGAT